MQGKGLEKSEARKVRGVGVWGGIRTDFRCLDDRIWSTSYMWVEMESWGGREGSFHEEKIRSK